MKNTQMLFLTASLCLAASCIAEGTTADRAISQERIASDETWARVGFHLYPKEDATNASGYRVSLDLVGSTYELIEDEELWGKKTSFGDFSYSLQTFIEKDQDDAMPETAEEFVELLQEMIESDGNMKLDILATNDPEVVYAVRLEGVYLDEYVSYENDVLVKEEWTPRYISTIFYYTQKKEMFILSAEMESAERFEEVSNPFDWQPNAQEMARWERIVSSVTFEHPV